MTTTTTTTTTATTVTESWPGRVRILSDDDDDDDNDHRNDRYQILRCLFRPPIFVLDLKFGVSMCAMWPHVTQVSK